MIDLKSLSKSELENLLILTKQEISNYRTMDSAIKISLNSCYGVLSNEYFMFFDIRSAEAVTISGQIIIRYIATRLNEYLNGVLKTKSVDYVLYIDTDSVSLKMEPMIHAMNLSKTKETLDFLVKVYEQKIIPFIGVVAEELRTKFNARENFMSMKIDTISDRVMMFSKKRYMFRVLYAEGVYYAEPENKIVGIDAIKSSTPEIVRSAMIKTLDLILDGNEEVVQSFVSEYKKQFFDSPIPKIAFPRGVSDVNSYSDSSDIYKKGTPIHAKASIIYNHTLKTLGIEGKYPPISGGDRIYFVYMKPQNPLRQDVFGFPDTIPREVEDHYKISKYVDRQLQFEKTFHDPIKKIMETVGMTPEPSEGLF